MTATVAKQYIEDVLKGVIPACKPVINAIKRHQNDLQTLTKQGYYFDEKAAEKVLRFFSFLRHSKGKWAGTVFELAPWQVFCLYVIFGWKRSDGTRRFRDAYIEVPRKNGKTSLAAGISLYMLIADSEQGAEIYTGATTRDQAMICFEEAQNMVRKSPDLTKRATVYKYNIHVLPTASKMEPVSSDHNTLDGLNPHCVILDEIHAYKTSGLYDIFKSAVGARSQPLIFMITTAGFNKTWFCYGFRKSVLGILDGTLKDESTFGIIFTLDEDDDWQDPAVWTKANPNLGISVFPNYLESTVYTAVHVRPSEQINVKTKNLNVWTDASEVWIEKEFWDQGAGKVNKQLLHNKPIYCGIDLSATNDITALAGIIPDNDGSFDLLIKLYITERAVLRRKSDDMLPLQEWINNGWLSVTPGNVVDYDYLYNDIEDWASLFDVQFIAYDRWNSSDIVKRLNNLLGETYVDTKSVTKMQPFGQGYQSMSSPTKIFETLVLNNQLRHEGNPMLAWMLSNVELERDPAGNVKASKAKSSEKIDGIVATIMALGMYQMIPREENVSQYNSTPFVP